MSSLRQLTKFSKDLLLKNNNIIAAGAVRNSSDWVPQEKVTHTGQVITTKVSFLPNLR